jgi:hypothetical protein
LVEESGQPSGRKGTGCQSANYSSCAYKSFLWALKASSDVFADFYRFSAYDTFALLGLFSVLRNVVLGHSPINNTATVFSSANDSSCIPQFNRAASKTCTLQEIHDNVISAGDQVTQE